MNPPPDLRRRRRRDVAEQIVARAAHLDPADCALLEAVYGEGRPVKSVAHLLSVAPGAPTTRSLRRRVRRLIRRVSSPCFTFVVHHLKAWPTTRQRVAVECFLRGRSTRQAAQRLGLSYYTARRQYEAIRALAESSGVKP